MQFRCRTKDKIIDLSVPAKEKKFLGDGERERERERERGEGGRAPVAKVIRNRC